MDGRFQSILTDRLRLRDLRRDDAEAMFAYRSNPGVAEYQSWVPQSRTEVEAFIESMSHKRFDERGWYQIGITGAQSETLIGDCGIHVFEADPRVVEVGITIAPNYQRNGYGCEALTAVFNMLFGQLKKHRVVASVDPRNAKSLALMDRIGMRKEAHLRKSLWFKNEWADDVVFAMLESEWAQGARR